MKTPTTTSCGFDDSGGVRPSVTAAQLATKQIGENVVICGRVLRKTSSGSMVILFDGAEVTAEFAFSDGPRVGDIVAVVGTFNEHASGERERTLYAAKWKLLSATRCPDLFEMATDRPREIALLRDSRLRRALEVRRRVIRATREYLDGEGYQEVDTPVILPVRDIAPVPHFTVLPSATGDQVLRISPENALKRLVVAGFDRVYEVSRNFRPADTVGGRLPEFTSVECYRAYADYLDMVGLFEGWVSYVIRAATGAYTLKVGGLQFDFAKPWLRLDYHDAVKSSTGIDVDLHPDFESLWAAIKEAGISTDGVRSRREALNRLAEQVEASTVAPTLLMNHPSETICVAKRHSLPMSSHRLERFEAFVGGVEIAHAFSELTDPDEQRHRMQLLLDEKAANGDEPHALDDDFLTALDVGLPPTAGLGVGIDRLVMLVTGEPADRVVAFPYSSLA